MAKEHDVRERVSTLADGLGHPEGPDVLGDGSVVFVETYRGRVLKWLPESGAEVVCHTGGGPNACLCGDDGLLYITQSGGTVGGWSAGDGVPGCLQRATLDGTVEMLLREIDGEPLGAPNDLAFGPDGALWFTDSGRFDLEARPDEGFICRLAPDGRAERVVRTGRTYPNGIVVEADGAVVWVETYTRLLRRRSPDGTVTTTAEFPPDHYPDGFKIDTEGRFWVTVTAAGGLDVVTADGACSAS